MALFFLNFFLMEDLRKLIQRLQITREHWWWLDQISTSGSHEGHWIQGALKRQKQWDFLGHAWFSREEWEGIQEYLEEAVILKNWTHYNLVAIFLSYDDRYLGSSLMQIFNGEHT